jgi:phosphoribosylanthranilate isomerase
MMAATRVKICGLTRLEDAELAVALGADALGFVFWPNSPRRMTPEAAGGITRALPPFPARVGVFVNAPLDEIARAVDVAGLSAVQLHGDERPADYAALRRPLIKAVPLGDDEPAVLESLPPDVVALVDAADPRRGGTGRTADWARAARAAARRRIMLAGGLTPENVGTAIRAVRPWAVDVSSGVEARPGVKDPGRMRAFFTAVRQAERESEGF